MVYGLTDIGLVFPLKPLFSSFWPISECWGKQEVGFIALTNHIQP